MLVTLQGTIVQKMINVSKTGILLVLFFLIGSADLRGQYLSEDFIHYSIKDGLSDNNVSSFLQDNQGYLWISTEHGLNRFNGNEFENFHTNTIPVRLSGEKVARLKKLRGDHIGILTRDGAQVLNTRSLQLNNLTIPDTTDFRNFINQTHDLIECSSGNFILTTGTGFYMFDPQFRLTYRFDRYNKHNSDNKTIRFGRYLLEIDNHTVLISYERNGLMIFDPLSKKAVKVPPNHRKYGLIKQPFSDSATSWYAKYQMPQNKFILVPSFQSLKIYWLDLNSNKYVESQMPFARNPFDYTARIRSINDSTFIIHNKESVSGFYMFHLDPVTHKISFNQNKMFSGHKITALFMDDEKRLWIGTNKGIFRQRLYHEAVQRTDFSGVIPDSLTSGITSSCIHNNKIYAGMDNKRASILILDQKTLRPEKTIAFYGGHNNYTQVYSISHFRGDTLWIGVYYGLMWLDTKTLKYGRVLENYFTSHATSLLKDTGNRRMWVIEFFNGRLSCFDMNSSTWQHYSMSFSPGLPFKKIKRLTQDSEGNIWLAGHGLCRFNLKTRKFDRIHYKYGGMRDFDENIIDISADKHGNLWFYTPDNGMFRYIIQKDSFVHYLSGNGLPSDFIYNSGPMVHDNWWFETRQNLSFINTRTDQVTMLYRSDGIPDESILDSPLFYDEKSDFLYWFKELSVYHLKPGELYKQDFFRNFSITEIKINDEEIIPGSTPVRALKWNENNIQLRFGVIDFEEERSYYYEYKINDADWIRIGFKNNLTLSSLKPGKYNVMIRAVNKFGRSQVCATEFFIRPPLHQRTWFLILAGTVAISLISFLFLRELIKIKTRSALEKKLAQSRMQALHAQMNPHFVFNSLNSINDMVIHDRNDQASFYLSRFAKMLRLTLGQSGHIFVTLRESLNYMQLYFEMEHIRNPRFSTQFDIDEGLDLDEILIPPMLLQPFFENAIWHGPGAEQLDIHILFAIRIRGELAICSIVDDGIGINRSNELRSRSRHHQPFGLGNIRERIEILNNMYKFQCKIEITDRSRDPEFPGRGTVARIYLPLNFELS